MPIRKLEPIMPQDPGDDFAELEALRSQHHRAYKAEANSHKLGALTRAYNRDWKRLQAERGERWWSAVQQQYGICQRVTIELPDTDAALVELASWLFEQPLAGQIKVCPSMEIKVHRTPCNKKRRRYVRSAFPICWKSGTVYFTDARDATLFKLTFGGN